MKKIIILILFLLISGRLVMAQSEIRLFVSPEMFEWRLEREEEFSEKIKIYNKSEVPVPIKASVTNFGTKGELGTITFFEEPEPKEGKEDISYNPRKWIKIENPDFILDSKETEEVRFLVSIPENAEPGGHYAVILFEPMLPSFYFEEKALRAIPKIGVLFLISVEIEGLTGPAEPLTIVEFNIPENLHLKRLENFIASFAGLFTEVRAEEKAVFSIVETSHLPFTLRIKNNDIFHHKPEGNLLIYNTFGKIVGETEVRKTTILPGKIRKFPVKFKPELSEKLTKYLPAAILNFISQNLFWGKYQAQLVLTTENDIIEKNIEFWAFPWKVGLSTVFIAFIFLLFLVKYRKRIKSAILIIFRGVRPRKIK